MQSDALTEDEGYEKSLSGLRKFALAVPSLSVSLSSACLAFEVYFLRYVYELRSGLQPDDLIAILPVVTGALFLLTAVLCVDWLLDSLSDNEIAALDAMHRRRDGADYRPYRDANNGWAWRRRLFSGGYLLFCICLGMLFFLLVASIGIFLPNTGANQLIRGSLLGISAYYSCLVILKMMTNHISSKIWHTLILAAAILTAGNFYLTAKLMAIF